MNKRRSLAAGGLGCAAAAAVNFIIYFAFCHSGMNYLDANTTAWIIAIFIWYCIERRLICQSRNTWYKDLFSFYSRHLSTLLAETILLLLAVDGLHTSSPVSKVIISIVTALVNFFIYQNKVHNYIQTG